MSEIRCPNCGKTFAVDESGYAELIKQARDEEFARQVAVQKKQVEETAKAQAEAAAVQAQARLSETVASKDAEIDTLKAQLAAQATATEAQVKLAARQAADAQAETLAQAQRERDELATQLAALTERAAVERELAAQRAEAAAADKLRAAERERDDLRTSLQAQEAQAKLEVQLAVQKAEAAAADKLRAAERKRDELAAQAERSALEIENVKAQHQNELATRTAVMQEQIDARDREIDNIKHMRAELSVKMIGESLEQFCESEFNKLRATAFQTSYFEKDNDASDGSKGDYIYREFDEEGNEIVSIMFEMKNEADDSTHKKRNEDHFNKLNRDRNAKGCEYAVLVSLLERDNEFYNTGIVDVSYTAGFEKMYVIRPQFFIPLITLLRNAAMRSLGYRRELAEVRRQNVDVTAFEDQLEDFKGKFGKNCELASRKFQDAIKDIDATIKKLEKIRDELTSSDNNLRYANDKLNSLTVKRLTRKNPTMKAKFTEAREQKQQEAPQDENEEVWEAEYLED